MEYILKDLFPELSTRVEPLIYSPSITDLENNTYFKQLVDNILEEYGQ